MKICQPVTDINEVLKKISLLEFKVNALIMDKKNKVTPKDMGNSSLLRALKEIIEELNERIERNQIKEIIK